MAFNAKVLQVMIASPGDVAGERQAFRAVIEQWNSIHALEKKVILFPMTWELDVPPEYGIHPQDLINNRIVERTDLLIGVFWTRLGTSSERSKGGAVEEIDLHLKRGKPALVYFSDAPINPSKVDQAQLAALRAFKQDTTGRGLLDSYGSLEEFSSKLLRNIHQTISQNLYFQRILEDSEQPDGRISSRYLDEFSRSLVKATSESRDGRFVIRASNGTVTIEIDGRTAFSSRNNSEYQVWLDEIVSLTGKELIRDSTNRGEVYDLSESGRRLAKLL